MVGSRLNDLITAASSPLYYITALTALFESIAVIVDQHQPVVESYYGTGKMASVIARLLRECDRVCKGLIEGWEEERGMKRKVRQRQRPNCVGLNSCIACRCSKRELSIGRAFTDGRTAPPTDASFRRGRESAGY